jgi:hypothetical protein
MKKGLLILGCMLLAISFGSCSKDENEPVLQEQAVQNLQALQAISGTWYFEEQLADDNFSNTGMGLYGEEGVSTRTELGLVNMYMQEITIDTNGRFNWQKVFYFPNTWLIDKECYGEKTETYDLVGRVDITETKLSFFYDQPFIYTSDISFDYELSEDKQTLLLHGKTDGYNPLSYDLKFHRTKP